MTSRVGVLGDVHCNDVATRAALAHFHELGISEIYQVGDFGIYDTERGKKYLDLLQDDLAKHGQTLRVLLGNREDYDYVEALRKENNLRAGQSLFIRPLIEVFPRVKKFKLGKRTVLAVTGAPSPDRTARLKRPAGTTRWWKQEQVRKRDVLKAVLFGRADILLTHDAPFVPHIDKMIAKPRRNFEEKDLAYALIGRKRQETIFRSARPKLQFHGHYHEFHESLRGKSMIVGLAKDTQDGNYGILDVDKMEFTRVGLSNRYYQKWVKDNTWYRPMVYSTLNGKPPSYEYTLPLQLDVVISGPAIPRKDTK